MSQRKALESPLSWDNTNIPEVVNIKEAATMVGVAPSTIRYWILTGRLPARRSWGGKQWRILASDVERASEEMASPSPSHARGPRSGEA